MNPKAKTSLTRWLSEACPPENLTWQLKKNKHLKMYLDPMKNMVMFRLVMLQLFATTRFSSISDGIIPDDPYTSELVDENGVYLPP